MPELNPQIKAILDDLADLAVNAKLVGGPDGNALAKNLEAVVARFSNGTSAEPATPAAGQEQGTYANPLEAFEDIANGASAEQVARRLPDGALELAGLTAAADSAPDAQEEPARYGTVMYDGLGDLEDQINEIGAGQLAAATPQDLTLRVTSRNGGLTEAAVRGAALDLQPTLEAVVGPLVINDDIAIANGTGTVTLSIEGDDGSRLAQLGAGTDGFSAALPGRHGGILDVIATIGMPADEALAAELGMLAPELPAVPDGQHAINGMLEVVQDMTGHRPQAQPMFTVTYTRDDGGELTEEQVNQILEHPVSDALRRLGANQHVHTANGPDVSVKVAHFALLANDGDIDMATVALGATAYRGTFNFGPAIGSVTANAQAQLVDIDVDVDVDA